MVPDCACAPAVEPVAQAADEGVDVRRGPGELQEAGGVSFQAGGRAGTEAFEVDDSVQILGRCVASGQHGVLYRAEI